MVVIVAYYILVLKFIGLHFYDFYDRKYYLNKAAKTKEIFSVLLKVK